MDSNWLSIADFLYLSLFLAIGTFLKNNFKVFHRFLIPTSILAGGIGLIMGPEILGWVPINSENLEIIIYHLMAIGFIALTLKERNHTMNVTSFKTGLIIVGTYLIQGIVGFSITLGLLYTILPDIFPPLGLLLPLGFGQGPGQSFSIGKQWESLGFLNGGQIGLTIATLGFLWACIGGVILINILVKKKGYTPHQLHPFDGSMISDESEGGEIPLSSGLDKITVQFFLIGIVYLMTYLTLKGLTFVLTPMGTFGQTMAQLFWGFHFIIGTLYAMLLRLLYDFFLKDNPTLKNYPNNYLLQRISGVCFDFMITASISAISIRVVQNYLLPISMVTITGALATIFFVLYVSKKQFPKNSTEHALALYGMLTGTISTGLALLKEVDPQFKTQVAENLVLGSAVGLMFGLPLMMILNIPIVGYVQQNPTMYMYTLITFVLYLGLILLLLRFINRKSR